MLDNFKSKYILEKVFEVIPVKRKIDIIKYNKKILKRLNITKEEIELVKSADLLYKVINESETNNRFDILIKLIVKYPLKIRLKIRDTFYKQDLLKDLESNLDDDFQELMLGLYKDIYEYDAEQCNKAFKGFCVDEETLIEIICTRPSWMLKKIKGAYKKIYNNELEDDIIDNVSGDCKRLLISLLQCERSENKTPDKNKIFEMANDLFRGDKNNVRIDMIKISKYLCLSSPIELMYLAKEFNRRYEKSLIKQIEEEETIDFYARKLIKTIFYGNLSVSEYFATKFYKALRGLGINEKILTRVTITRNEVDMKKIKEYYKILYSRNLVDDIKMDTDGFYQKLLVALIDK